MKFHQFFIISLCNFILLTCYTTEAQTVGGVGVVYEGPAVVNESDPFTLMCFSSPFVVFKWRRNGGNVDFGSADNDDSYSQVDDRNETSAYSNLTINSALSEHGGNYKCTSDPEIEDYGHNLTVICAAAPQVNAVFSVDKRCNSTKIPRENCVLGTLYAPLTLRCVHQLNDSFTARWYSSKDGVNTMDSYTPVKATDDGRVKLSGDQMDISQLWPQDITYYSCRVMPKKSASEKDDLAPVAQGTFEVQALPIAIPIMKDMTVVEGSQINVSCSVTGKASGVVWKFGEKDLFNGTDNRVTLKEFRGIPDATLLISQANSTTDRGTYHCTALSNYGNGTTIGASFVRVKSKYAALGPFLGICAEVIILCTIILIYEKKRDKTELEESDTDQGPETKSSPDHGQDSVRYRK